MEGIPVLDQDGIPLCFAYTSAVAVSAWQRSHSDPNLSKEEKDKMIISPLIAGMLSSDPEYKLPGCETMLSTCSVANFLNQQGTCPIDQVIQRVGGGGKQFLDAPGIVMDNCVRWEVPGTTKIFTDDIVKLHNYLKQFSEEIWTSSPVWREYRTNAINAILARSDGAMSDAEKFAALQKFYMSSNTVYRTAMATFAPGCFDIKDGKDENSFTYLGRKGPAFNACKSQDLYGDKCIPVKANTPLSYKKMLDEQLDKKNPQPAMIQYCWTFLVDGEKRRPEKFYKGIRTSCEKKAGDITSDHKSLIIGRRKSKSGKCEFLLRNSWGNDCNSYASGTSMANSCWEELRINKAADIWVPSDILTNNMYGMSYLE